MLMSFVGAVGTLITETGLSEILKLVFGGVEKMLTGKNCIYPQVATPSSTTALVTSSGPL